MPPSECLTITSIGGMADLGTKAVNMLSSLQRAESMGNGAADGGVRGVVRGGVRDKGDEAWP